MRIDSLTQNNRQTQGNQRRAWLQQYAPQHLHQCRALMLAGLQARRPSAARSVLVLGAGACTEVPLIELVRASDEVVLADLDAAAMQQGRDELPEVAQRKRVRLAPCDVSGGLSTHLRRIISRQTWPAGTNLDAQSLFDLAAQCLEQCVIPDPPALEGLAEGDSGLVVSSLVLSQLFSYPLLDLLDHIQRLAPDLLSEQERHRRYQDAVQHFRVRVITAHLHLLTRLADAGAAVVLLSDVRGFVFNVHGTDHDAQHRRAIPLVPRQFPQLIQEHFMISQEAQWEWVTDLPEQERPGRGYEVAGYVLLPRSAC